MEKILEQLYKGEIYPYSTFQTTIEEFKKTVTKPLRLTHLFWKNCLMDLKMNLYS